MSDTIVKTIYGQVEGEALSQGYVWRGIPYARAPIGSRRFKRPEPPESWNGVREATEFGPIPHQQQNEIMAFLGNSVENMSEDCLYLNVWSPAADNRKRPVLVWIHGGAFVTGSGSSFAYDGASFIKNGDVVVVTLNYRLGALGFLHLAELGGEEYATSGNNGLFDQIAALKWIRANIEFFGGDPDRVTVFGESAGAMSIGALLTMPEAKGLFQQAILESGAAHNVVTVEKANEMTNLFLKTLNIEEHCLSLLIDMPVEKLIEASAQLPSMRLVPVVDGISIPIHPEQAIAEGGAKDINVLIGTNKDEFTLFTAFDPRFKAPTEETVATMFEELMGKHLWKKLAPFITAAQPLTPDLLVQFMTFSVFTGPALKLAEDQVKNGGNVWMYRFDWETDVQDGLLKSCHALELPFVWNTVANPLTERLTGDGPERQALANQIQQAWIAFARSGDPNHQDLPLWEPYDLETRPTLIFNVESKLVQDPDRQSRLLSKQMTTLLGN
ncbi:carboxylesterase/lipase family protein [Pullulanibacillus sp. KACC 23026]|uniref:carboxylesterase/lipase family protein n=1 Tax=Pullulanibacillus sp. KACC 23026 TaxID=3028315 RepID=UPI0023B11414|nr:carboxylesterase/lipase family protein [Pullulanibacillus sp. KACC 23026]WEG12337.1 carboxylesterase/lipase family protein [Pullulanibacillus sp. KACC 23026]